MSNWHIYGLKDPRDGRIRYIGRTTQPRKRFTSHLRDRSTRTNQAKVLWIAELEALGLKPIMEILESVVNEPASEIAERSWILTLRSDGTLTNIALPPAPRGWRVINVPVADHVYRSCKIAAARAGMTLRKWVEQAIRLAIEIESGDAL